MRIGVDFDGVLADPTREKQLFARKYFGVDLKSQDCTTRRAEALIRKPFYSDMIECLEYGPNIPNFDPVPHANQVLANLMHHGHQVVIITTLTTDDGRMDWAKAFLHRNGIPYSHWTSLSRTVKDKEGSKEYGYKRVMCDKMKVDVMVDDDVRNLSPMSGSGRLLLLFDQPWNRDQSLQRDVIRVFGWLDAMQRIYQQGKSPSSAPPVTHKWNLFGP